MWSLPDPIWPVCLLAAVTTVDGVLCLQPVGFVAECLEAVGWPRRWWRLLPLLKFAAAAGLLAGIVVPGLGFSTCVCLVLYFVVAVALHVQARDLGRNLFVNASGMLLLCVATLLWSFLL